MAKLYTDEIEFCKLMKNQPSRILAIDYGEKKVGLAMATTPDLIPFEIGICLPSKILDNITLHKANFVAIGFPFAYSGGVIGSSVLNLAAKIIADLQIDVILIEEAGTSVIAKNRLKDMYGRINKNSLESYDSLAAKIILELLLNSY